MANLNNDALAEKKALKGEDSSYDLNTNDFDEASFNALQGLAENGKTGFNRSE